MNRVTGQRGSFKAFGLSPKCKGNVSEKEGLCPKY
jgi:hypothetical protein